MLGFVTIKTTNKVKIFFNNFWVAIFLFILIKTATASLGPNRLENKQLRSGTTKPQRTPETYNEGLMCYICPFQQQFSLTEMIG